MNIGFFTSNRLLADSLTAGLRGREGISTVRAVDSFSALREILATAQLDLVLFDVTRGIDLDEVRSLADDYSQLVLLALGPKEQERMVMRHGHAGFSDYIHRHATIEELVSAMSEAVRKHLANPPELQRRSSGRFCGWVRGLSNPFRMKGSGDAKREHDE